MFVECLYIPFVNYAIKSVIELVKRFKGLYQLKELGFLSAPLKRAERSECEREREVKV